MSTPIPSNFVYPILDHFPKTPGTGWVEFLHPTNNYPIAPAMHSLGENVRQIESSYLDPLLHLPEVGKHHHIASPPMRLFSKWATKAVDETPGRVALLAPISSMGGLKRFEDLWTQNPPDRILVFSDRMRLPTIGVSQYNHVWYLWDTPAKRTGQTRLDWVVAGKEAS